MRTDLVVLGAWNGVGIVSEAAWCRFWGVFRVFAGDMALRADLGGFGPVARYFLVVLTLESG